MLRQGVPRLQFTARTAVHETARIGPRPHSRGTNIVVEVPIE
jgi:hypothetical protein